MILGILSDSHGDAIITSRAVALLERLGATRFVHCGDLCSLGVLDELAGRDCVFVWGNCDDPSPKIRSYVERIGLVWPDGRCALEAEGKRIAVFHGHERIFTTTVQDGGYDYIFYGHTHRAADERVNGMRLINPGALYRVRIKSVATLDVSTDLLRYFDVETEAEVEIRRSEVIRVQ